MFLDEVELRYARAGRKQRRTRRRKFSFVLDKACDKQIRSHRVFMCQDENEIEPEDQKFLFILDNTCDERTRLLALDFFRHTLFQERTKSLVLVFVFVFVLAHEQAISTYDTLKDRFVRYALATKQTKVLVFIFVFALAHEQAISALG